METRLEVGPDYSAHVCREGVAAEPAPVASRMWDPQDSAAAMRVDTLFEAPRGQAGVYLAHGFVSAEECRELR